MRRKRGLPGVRILRRREMNRTDTVPYGHHNPHGKTIRESITELWEEGYSLEAIAREIGLTPRGKRRAARWLADEERA